MMSDLPKELSKLKRVGSLSGFEKVDRIKN